MNISLTADEAFMLIAAIEDELNDCHLPDSSQQMLEDIRRYILSKLVEEIAKRNPRIKEVMTPCPNNS